MKPKQATLLGLKKLRGQGKAISPEVQELVKILLNEFSTEEQEVLAAITPPPVVPYNLIYHIAPIGNWLWNLDQLAPSWGLFTGKKVFAVAKIEGGSNFEDVQHSINHRYRELMCDAEFIEVVNHPILRETHSFPTLLLKASEFDREGYTFYGHTKGVTRDDSVLPAVQLWTEAMYHFNLETPRVFEMLREYPVVGSFKRYGSFANFPRASRWHYSGTFFWFRNDSLFSLPNWMEVPQSRYGTEAYLSMLFPAQKAGCIFADRFGNGYDWNYMRTLLGSNERFKKTIDYFDHTDRGSAASVAAVRKMGRTPTPPPR